MILKIYSPLINYFLCKEKYICSHNKRTNYNLRKHAPSKSQTEFNYIIPENLNKKYKHGFDY